MNHLNLVTMSLGRKPARTYLTLMSLIVAFLLFMLLRAITAAFSGGVAPSVRIATIRRSSTTTLAPTVPSRRLAFVSQMTDS